MAIVKFTSSGCPMNNIFSYVMRDEAAREDLIDGVNCSPDTVLDEFNFVKRQFHKESGRQYYHIVHSFAPDENVTPEQVHAIGMELAQYFIGYQVLVATHTNKDHLHSHLILNSVSYENGKMFHQSRDELLEFKRFSNRLCRKYGLSVIEEKTRGDWIPKWKRDLVENILDALNETEWIKEFIDYLAEKGIKVRWEPGRKYVTFTDADGHVCRDNKLFDERCLRHNMEIYFLLGGCSSLMTEDYFGYETPEHDYAHNRTVTEGLFELMGDLLCLPADQYDVYMPRPLCERSDWEKKQLEKILGHKISDEAIVCYSTKEQYEQENGIMSW